MVSDVEEVRLLEDSILAW